MPENIIRVSVKLEFQDYKKAARLFSRKSLAVFYTIMFVYFLIAIINENFTGLFYLSILLIGYEVLIQIRCKKGYTSNKRLNKEETITFYDENIEFLLADGSSGNKIRWDELYEAKRTKDIIALMTSSGGSGAIIPKRSLSNEQTEEIEQLIKNKLGINAFKKDKTFKWIFIVLATCILIFLVLVMVNVLQRLNIL